VIIEQTYPKDKKLKEKKEKLPSGDKEKQQSDWLEKRLD
jgi:hypothetical protein